MSRALYEKANKMVIEKMKQEDDWENVPEVRPSTFIKYNYGSYNQKNNLEEDLDRGLADNSGMVDNR